MIPRLLAFFLALALCPASLQAAPGEKVKLNGYAEYRQGGALIVEGQRLIVDQRTKFRGGPRNLESISLGYQVKVNGQRLPDGSVLAKKIEARPNSETALKQEVVQATNQIEEAWVKEGVMFTPTQDGGKEVIGKILESGPEVQRVRRIMGRLVPPYVQPSDLRVRVVDTEEWNASAMGNGAIWVYTGLLKEMSDDEMAIILGHELAHYTYEHTVRSVKKSQVTSLIALGAMIGLETMGAGAAQSAAGLGASLGLSALQSGYSRDMEDQADRVGLRYAYEGGFDVEKGPELWNKFREKYGEQGKLSNFLAGSHSRPSDRIANIEKELRMNYRDRAR